MSLPYFPIDTDGFKLTMGLKPLRGNDWIEIDDRYESEINIKRQLIADQRNDVFASTDDAQSAEAEVLERIQANLSANHPQISQMTNPNEGNDLIKAASLVQEDLVIMQEIEGSFRLTSAVVCFPSAWDLAQKVGKTMREIHAPIPHVNDEIGNSIDLFFNNMKASKSVQRFNWGLYDREALFQPSWWRAQQNTPDVTIENIGEKTFLRVEKQTLQRLSNERDTLFTIRIFNTPLAEVAEDPERAAILLNSLKTMPADYQDYKSIKRYKDLYFSYLEKHSA